MAKHNPNTLSTPELDFSNKTPKSEAKLNPFVVAPALLGMVAGGYYGYNTLKSQDIIHVVTSFHYLAACSLSSMIAGGTIGFVAEQLIENPIHTMTNLVGLGMGATLGANYGFNCLGTDDKSLYIFNYLASTVGLVIGSTVGFVTADIIGKNSQYLGSTADNSDDF